MEVSAIKKILATLIKDGNNKSLYYFHKKFALSPSEIFQLVQELTSKGFIRIIDKKISITSSGKQELLSNKKIYFYKTSKKWLEIPIEFKGNKISINELYTPKYFDKKYLKKLESDKH